VGAVGRMFLSLQTRALSVSDGGVNKVYNRLVNLKSGCCLQALK